MKSYTGLKVHQESVDCEGRCTLMTDSGRLMALSVSMSDGQSTIVSLLFLHTFSFAHQSMGVRCKPHHLATENTLWHSEIRSQPKLEDRPPHFFQIFIDASGYTTMPGEKLRKLNSRLKWLRDCPPNPQPSQVSEESSLTPVMIARSSSIFFSSSSGESGSM